MSSPAARCIFSNFADQRIYGVAGSAARDPAYTRDPAYVQAPPESITPEGQWFYADLVVDVSRRRLICVREDHTQTGREPRSPIHFADHLSCAQILFQGLDDKVVPSNQSQMMADAVREKGLPVAYLTFEGEQHGFRKAETIVRCLEAELYFYGAVFGFTPADTIPPVLIANRP